MSTKKYSTDEVIDFCKTKEIIIVNRDKNNRFRWQVGKTIDDEIEIIRNLESKFCTKENFEDLDRPGNYLFEFKTLAFDKWCYIKLTIIDESIIVKVISFHESEGEMYE